MKLILLLLFLLHISIVTSTCDFYKNPKCAPTNENHNGKSYYERNNKKLNEQCCYSKKLSKDDINKCINYRYKKPPKSTEMARCFGASGADCFGIEALTKQGEIAAKLGKNIGWKKLTKLGKSILIIEEDGHIYVPTSVGSIYHDSCCLTYPNGFFCNDKSRPYMSFLEKKRNNCPCALEWRKAVLSLMTGRWWHTKYRGTKSDPYSVAVSDLTPTGKKLPTTRLPESLGKWKELSNYYLMETVATSKLRAPPGTMLDCPSVDKGCRTGFLKFKRVADDYEEEHQVLKNAKASFLEVNDQTSLAHHPRRLSLLARVKEIFARTWAKIRGKHEEVDHSKKGGIVAGDSKFCASGKFKSVHFRLSFVPYFRRYGICA